MSDFTDEETRPWRRARAPSATRTQATVTYPATGGQMEALMRAKDWSQTRLGPRDAWSPGLKTALSIVMSSRFPMMVFWGAELCVLYNDACIPIFARKHPDVLGRTGREAWGEIWDVIGPMFDAVMARGETTWSDDQLLSPVRKGFVEESYFTWSYSPITDESGGVGGVFTAVTETTERVLGQRRLSTLSELAESIAPAQTMVSACRQAAAVVEQDPEDIPFALFYLLDGDGQRAHLVATCGLAPGAAASPTVIDVASNAPWPLAAVRDGGQAVVVTADGLAFAALPGTPWPEPCHTAIVLPIAGGAVGAGDTVQPCGFMVAGTSPRLELDDAYRAFLDLVANKVASAVGHAKARETEKQRAAAPAPDQIDRGEIAFLSNVSHEFRTPLTLMLGPTSDLLSGIHGDFSPAQREQLELLHRNSLRLERLVNSLFDPSRLEAGGVQATFQPIDLPSDRVGVVRHPATIPLSAGPTPEPRAVHRSFSHDSGEWVGPESPRRNERGGPDQRASAPRILLVDDNADMRAYVHRLLTTNWRVDTAVDGAAALSSVRSDPPDLVLTDVMMPNLDGFGLLRALREDPRTAAIPVIILSARAGEGPKMDGMPAGADDYIIKPFSARELHARVATHLELARLRARAERERSKLHSLFTNAPALVFMVKGPDHVFELANPLYLQFIGNRDVLGKPIREALPDLADQGFYELLDEVYRTGQRQLAREALLMVDRGDDGRPADSYVNFTYQPSHGSDGQVEGVLAFAFDVTDQVLARRRAEESQRVAERARAESEAAVRMRDDFLSIASHELRTPLTTLGLQTDSALRMLRRGDGSPATLISKMETVRRSANRLEQIIQGLLDVSRIAVGKLDLKPQQLDIVALTAEVCQRFELEAARAGSKLSLSAEGTVFGRWDSLRLDQVITNVLANAIKYGQGQPIDVVVTETPNAVRIEVRDRGIGIKAENQDRIFGRFERAVSDRHFGGFGLGLWITRELVNAMGGDISVASAVGEGSSFIVQLPKGMPP